MSELPADGASSAPHPGPGFGARAARGFLWTMGAFGANRLLVFASTLVLARLLAPEDFGIVAAGLTLVLYLEVALDLGLGAAVVYEQETGISRRVQTAFTVTITVATALTVLGMVLAPLLADFFRASNETTLFRAIFLSILLRGAGQVPDALLRRDLRFVARSATDTARGVVRLGVTVGLAFAGAGPWAIVGGLLASDVTGTTLVWALARFRPTFTLDRAALKVLLGFGGSVVLLKALDAVATDIDYLVVGRILGLTALGHYTIAYRLPELLLLNVFWVFSSVAFPIYAAVRSSKPRDFGGAVLHALRLVTLYSLPVAVGLALLSRDTVLVLFGDKWAPAVLPMTLLALTAIPMSLGYASGDVFPAIGRPGLLLAFNVPMSAVLVVCLIAAAPYGITAVAAAHLGVTTVYGIARVLLANRIVGTTLAGSVRAMRPGLAAAAGVLLVAGPVRLLADAGVGTLALLGVAVVAGGALGLLLGGRDAVADLSALARSAAHR